MIKKKIAGIVLGTAFAFGVIAAPAEAATHPDIKSGQAGYELGCALANTIFGLSGDDRLCQELYN